MTVHTSASPPALPTPTASKPLTIVILGLTITSSWGNSHAPTYRALVRALVARGHQVLFLERDLPPYGENRDLPQPPDGRTALYPDLATLQDRFATEVRQADLVIVGSYVPQGVEVGRWVQQLAQGVTVFYDIDTPVTLAKLRRGDEAYLAPELIPGYDLYLSFTGGPLLATLEEHYGAPAARPLYCSFEPTLYYPEPTPKRWDLGYMGTYSADRQPGLEKLLLTPARQHPQGRFVVAGLNYPMDQVWPAQVARIEHLPPAHHRTFYNGQRFTLNLTRADMIAAGYSPSVRLFAAAACATPIISDYWRGLEDFFALDQEILVAQTARDVLAYLHDLPADTAQAIGERARATVLAAHTPAHRASALEGYVAEVVR